MSDKVKEWGLADIPEAPDYNRWEQAANEVKDKASKTELSAKADKSALANLASKTELEQKADQSALETKADKTALEAKADQSALDSLAARVAALESPAA